jgi:succinate dehydrogenase / fumarate reductase, cytochrome b subunit
MSNSAILKSSLAKKYWMAATGLFLCTFLLGHLAGNFQLFIGGEEGQLQFNEYAKFMTTNPLVKILSYVTYISILFHAIDGIMLTVQNRAARPVKYAYEKQSANANWTSRNMALLGTVLLIFIIAHMANFWAVMHFDTSLLLDANNNKDLHSIVLAFFGAIPVNENIPVNQYGLIAALLYAIAMLGLMLHLLHGVQSAFQSLGLNHPKYNPIIKKVGQLFAIVVALSFAIIPLYIHFIL